MAFNPGQLEVLQLLLNLSPEQRSRALKAALANDRAPLSPSIRRTVSRPLSPRTPVSDDSSITGDSEASVASGTPNRKRVHNKNRITRLATKICREYLNCQRMWDHLYSQSNRVIEHKLDDVLDQICVKLDKSEQKTLKTYRSLLKKAVKKRMAAGRRYRKKQKEIGKEVAQAHKSAAIDLTRGGDEGDNSNAAASETASETPTEPSVKSESVKSESAKSEKKESPKPASPSQRELALDFKARMENRRNTKKTKRQAEKEKSVPKKKRSRRTTRKEKFPYPLGTVIARDFNGEIFTGKISKLYPDDPSICQVTYTDGDKEDFDAEQVTYGSALYVRDCGESLKKS